MRIASGEFLRFSHPRRRRRLHPVARDFGRALRVVAVLVPLMIFVYWLIAAETFALAEIEIKENPRVPASWMRRAIEAELGGNLVILPLSRVRERLSGHPWLANVEVHKELPDRLFVEVDERLAVAVLEAEDGAYFIDGFGSAYRAGSTRRECGGAVATCEWRKRIRSSCAAGAPGEVVSREGDSAESRTRRRGSRELEIEASPYRGGGRRRLSALCRESSLSGAGALGQCGGGGTSA